MATALICGANEFLTFDKGGKDKKYLGLLGLSKDPRIDELLIKEPEMPAEPFADQKTPDLFKGEQS